MPKPPGRTPCSGADFQAAGGLVGRIGDGGVGDGVEGEAFAGVLDQVNNGSGGAHVGDADALVGVGSPAVLDGVHQQLAKRGSDVIALARRKIHLHLAHELHQPVGCFHLAAQAEELIHWGVAESTSVSSCQWPVFTAWVIMSATELEEEGLLK